MPDDIQRAKLLAAYIRGDITPTPRTVFCTIGFPTCRCLTCTTKYRRPKDEQNDVPGKS